MLWWSCSGDVLIQLRPPAHEVSGPSERKQMTQTATDETAALVKRLARPHASGGMVIERSVILAEGANSAAILTWISEHDGIADSTLPSTPSNGLHGTRSNASLQAAPARRFVLPASAFPAARGS
jgi:hypothetical protein